MPVNPVIAKVTARIAERSRATREAYLDKIDRAKGHGPHRKRLSCGNLAHGFAEKRPHEFGLQCVKGWDGLGLRVPIAHHGCYSCYNFIIYS